ncbi:MAG: hypothetical protein JWM59_3090 [Verrucomicrobiales bacterium]|nr:hypothetical protein [Verrucomicrobiales bacterium]
MTAKEKLLAKFRKQPSLTKSALPKGKDSLAALQELLAEGLVVKVGTKYFSDTQAPTKEREMARIEAKLRSAVKLFKEGKLQLLQNTKLPTTRAALDELVDSRSILRLDIDGDKKAGPLYLHSAHALGGQSVSASTVSSPDMAIPPNPEPAASPPADPGPGIRRAYAALVQRRGTNSVFISELASEAGVAVGTLQNWLQKHAVDEGQGTLDEGDWSCATEEQRAAAMMLRDRRRLYIRLHS